VTGDLQLEIIESEISALLEKRAIEETQEIGFISSIFTIPKKSGGFRPVINLKALNNFVVYNHFKNGRLADSEKHYTTERLASKNRPHRCVFNSADPPVPPPLFAIHMEGEDLSVHLSSIWVIFCTENIYQTFKTRSCLFEEESN
jgi:hypothetical protein